MHLQFDIQLQCIQISTRINSSMYIRTYVFVSFETTPVVRIQILIDPIFNRLPIATIDLVGVNREFEV